MNESTNTKPGEVQPNDSQGNDEALSPKELGEISGGHHGGDPCEGGEIA